MEHSRELMEASGGQHDCSPQCSCGAHRLLTERKFDPPAKILTVPFGQKRTVGILRMHNNMFKNSTLYDQIRNSTYSGFG